MKKVIHPQLFVFIMVMLSAILLVATTLGHVTNAQPATSTGVPAGNQSKSEPVSSEKSPEKQYQQVNIEAVTGSSQSKLAMIAVEQIRSQKYIDDATAGKLQDKIMHHMGYQDFITPGTVYTFDAKSIDNLIYNAYVYDHEIVFWREYAQRVGLITT